MEKGVLKQKIIEYINAAYKWHEAGESSLDEGIGQTMAILEEEILTEFGLPFMAWQYSDILQEQGFSNINVKKRADILFEKLKNEAEKFLLAPIEKDIAILIEARNMLQDAVEVLPIIGITATRYNLFLYYEIFFRGIYNEDEILAVLKAAEKLDELAETTIPHTYDALNDNINFERLQKVGLPFLNEYKEFLKYKESNHVWDEHPGNYDLEDYVGLPNIFELDHFIITHVHVNDDETCCITVLNLFGKKLLVKLDLFCRKDMLSVIMLHAKYYSLSIPNLYLASPYYLNEEQVTIQLRSVIGKNIEIEKIKIGIEKIFDEDDGLQDLFAYMVTSIKASENIPQFHFKEP